jgi:hypothetical protein
MPYAMPKQSTHITAPQQFLHPLMMPPQLKNKKHRGPLYLHHLRGDRLWLMTFLAQRLGTKKMMLHHASRRNNKSSSGGA